ncbi:MAG: deoxyribodipyrimidine photo-lyase, partial [Limisphaerales bacterium]
MKRVIQWFRRDLRVHDNTALSVAVERAEVLIPVFVFEDALRTGRDVGAARVAFLIDSVRELAATLEAHGYPLVIRFGRSEVEIPMLAQELGVQAVFCNKRYEPYAQTRDNRVENALSQMGIGFESFKDAVIHEEREILTQAGEPYTVFTPYSKAWQQKLRPIKIRTLARRNPVEVDVRSEPIPGGPEAFGQKLNHAPMDAGERVGTARLSEFVGGGLTAYAVGRDNAAVDGTSRLSAHLRAGTVSTRAVLQSVLKKKAAVAGI